MPNSWLLRNLNCCEKKNSFKNVIHKRAILKTSQRSANCDEPIRMYQPLSWASCNFSHRYLCVCLLFLSPKQSSRVPNFELKHKLQEIPSLPSSGTQGFAAELSVNLKCPYGQKLFIHAGFGISITSKNVFTAKKVNSDIFCHKIKL